MRKLNVPAALFIGLVISFGGVFVLTAADLIGSAHNHDVELGRWFSFEYGTTVASAWLVAIALFGVTDRLTGTPRVLVQIAAWAHAGVAVWYVAQPLLAGLCRDADVYEKTEYIYRGMGVAAFGGMIALSIAARVWTKPSGITALAILALIAEICGSWAPYLGPWITDHVWSGGKIGPLYWVVREGALGVGTAALVHVILTGAPAALPEPRRAVFGFRLAGRALLARVLAAIALALLGVGMLTHPGSVKMMMFIAPTVIIVSTLAFSVGLLWVERANLPEIPRVRLLLGVAISVWGIGIDLDRISNVVFDDSPSGAPWTIASPLIGLFGTALIVSAIQRFASLRGDAQLTRNIGSRTALFFTMIGISVLTPLVVGGMTNSAESLIVLIVLAAACGIIGLVALAGMMSLVADALSGAPQLPEARLRS